MPFLNSVTIMGHLTADVDLRQLPSGDFVATFTLGVNSGRSDGKPGRGEFFRVDVWGGWAENLARTAKKGCLVIVEGRLSQDRWTDARTNETKSRVKVRASRAFHVTAHYPETRQVGVEVTAPGGAAATESGDDLPAPRDVEQEVQALVDPEAESDPDSRPAAARKSGRRVGR